MKYSNMRLVPYVKDTVDSVFMEKLNTARIYITPYVTVSLAHQWLRKDRDTVDALGRVVGRNYAAYK